METTILQWIISDNDKVFYNYSTETKREQLYESKYNNVLNNKFIKSTLDNYVSLFTIWFNISKK